MGSWQKILYRQQPFPDNYSGGQEQFLRELRKNVSAVQYRYFDAVVACCNLVFHVNCVILFYVLFEKVHNGYFHEEALLTMCFICLFILYLFYTVLLTKEAIDFKDHFYTITTLIFYGFGLTPIIRTLTTTISTDTVYATSIFAGFISCAFHDYGVKAPIVSMPLSISSGLCSAVFLLSRLKSNVLAFTLLSSAFAIYACSPYFRNTMFFKAPLVSSFATIVISLFTSHLISQIYSELAGFIILFQIFVVFICPYILIIKQRGKRTIHGPWDEAVPCKTRD